MNLNNILLNQLKAISLLGLIMSPSFAGDMSGGDIKAKITGKRVVLSSVGLEFPLFYNSNGRVTGDGSSVGLSKFFAPKETGKWWIADNQLCQKFPTWYKGQTFCFKLQLAAPNRLNWRRDDGYTGSAEISG